MREIPVNNVVSQSEEVFMSVSPALGNSSGTEGPSSCVNPSGSSGSSGRDKQVSGDRAGETEMAVCGATAPGRQGGQVAAIDSPSSSCFTALSRRKTGPWVGCP